MPLITDNQRLNEVCRDLASCEFITIDTEFLRDKTYYSKLCLVQVSAPDGTAYAIDPIAGDLDLSPLFELLQNPDVLKVLHAARQDLEIFHNLTGEVVTPFFDTQIAAMVCGYGDSVGYENLIRNVTGVAVDKSSQFTDWSRRPLSDKQLKYAIGDVTHLVDAYHHLKKELEKRGRTSWVFEEEEFLADPELYLNTPRNAWKRVKIRSPKPKTLSVLREIAAWREEQAQKRNIPRPWILKDETLADMASQAPCDANALQKIRNVSADMAKGRTGEALLECIQKGLNAPKDQMPQPKKKQGLPPSANAAVDVLKMLLKVQCAENEVATKLVASAADIEAIAINDSADVPALKGWRKKVFGEAAIALKHGHLAIGLKESKITKFRVSEDADIHE